MKRIITIHSSNTEANVNLRLADLDRRDRQAGFAGVGYHYVIRRDGMIEEGRADSQASVHDDVPTAKQAISICLVGGTGKGQLPLNNFTDEQWMALTQKMFQIQEDYPQSEIRVVTPAVSLEFVVGKYQKILSQWTP